MRGGAAHHRLWQARGERMPVAVVIGADPATILSAVIPTPSDVSELMISGVLSGGRPELIPCKHIDLHVPASSEIVLEGFAEPTETAEEGPFGDHTGYYNDPDQFPVFKVSGVRARKDPVYMSTFTGRAPDEPAVLSETMNDVFLPLLKQQIPEVVDLWLPPEACSYRIAVLKIKKSYPGQARRVMMGMWSLLPQFTMTKLIITVDEDIDCRSWSDVMWPSQPVWTRPVILLFWTAHQLIRLTSRLAWKDWAANWASTPLQKSGLKHAPTGRKSCVCPKN